MKKIFLTMALAIGLMGSAQVKIGNDPTGINAASLLELESTTQGVLFPRVTLTSTLTPTLAGGAHVPGMTVYNVGPATGDVTPGMYTNDGGKWVKLSNNVEEPLNVTTELTGDYTVLLTDDIILMTPTGAGSLLTLPTGTSGIKIGKQFYLSVVGSSQINIFNDTVVIRDSALRTAFATQSYIFTYIGSGQYLMK